MSVNFDLPESSILLRDTIRDFAKEKLEPVALENDENQTLPLDEISELAEMGMFGVTIDPDYGGAGMQTIDYVLILEEIARVDPAVCLAIAAHNSLACGHIALFGTEEQKNSYLTPLASGEYFGSWGLSEPGSGSDAAGLITMAEKHGDQFIINGSKNFITNGSHAKVMVVLAKTDKNAPGSRGVSAFIVKTDTPGYSVAKKENKLGMRASDTVQISFEDVAIPAENLLGNPGEGFKQAMKVLDGGRISIAALALGLAEGCYDTVIRYVQERSAFGKKLSEFQATQFKLADMHSEIEAARLLTYKAATLKDSGKEYTLDSATAKYYASEVCVRVASEAVQMLGGYGFIKEYPVERFFRDSRLTTIGEGTSEIQKIVIARQLLKMHGIDN
jgi:alkylation response protein AidB-like acyl-CoA dehydrogenase